MTAAEVLFEQQARLLPGRFPELALVFKDGKPVVEGYIILRDVTGIEIDRYQVCIEATNGYPYRFPKTFETGGRIPPSIEWHKFPEDGSCCLASPPAEIQACRMGLQLLDFIELHLTPYFFNQKFRELNGYFKDECPHGLPATINYFSELLDTESHSIIIKALRLAQGPYLPDRTSKCFCDSGKKYRKCHRERFLKLKEYIPKKEDIAFFIKCLEGN